MTVMSRLAEKGQLGREKAGLHYEYWLQAGSKTSILDKIKNKLLGVKTSILVCHLLENAKDLSESELDEVEKLLIKARISNQ